MYFGSQYLGPFCFKILCRLLLTISIASVKTLTDGLKPCTDPRKRLILDAKVCRFSNTCLLLLILLEIDVDKYKRCCFNLMDVPLYCTFLLHYK